MKQKNFKEIYDEIYQSCGKEMEKIRKKTLRKSIILISLPLLTVLIISLLRNMIIRQLARSGDIENGAIKFLTKTSFIFPLIIVAILSCFIIIRKVTKKYKSLFKEKIINEIVDKSNSTFKYNPNSGVSSNEYAESEFDYGWDLYSSEDLIDGKLEDGSNLKMSQVHTQERHQTTDSDGHIKTTYVTTFLGLYGIIKLKTGTKADFMIKANSKFSKFNKNRIEMESGEFEKYYDVFSGSKNNEIRQNAMELLTPEVIEEFVRIRNLFKTSLNLRIHDSKIYFRIDVGDIFEAPTFKSSMDFDLLQNYFSIIDVPRIIESL